MTDIEFVPENDLIWDSDDSELVTRPIQSLSALNACPTETIRRFINQSWRLMFAYRWGLASESAAWAVKKQRSHRTVSEGACCP